MRNSHGEKLPAALYGKAGSAKMPAPILPLTLIIVAPKDRMTRGGG
ncbi:hypothetical protein [Qipengyuania seohaensis]|nr:hypothetical protein [Qipengyuania seohaensis]